MTVGFIELESYGLYSTIRFKLQQTTDGLCKSMQQQHDQAFSAIAQLLRNIDSLLGQLGHGRKVDGLAGYNILHQIQFVLQQARDFAVQYGDQVYQPPVVFTEVYNPLVNQMVAKLQALEHHLENLLANISSTSMLPMEGLLDAISQHTAVDYTNGADGSFESIHSTLGNNCTGNPFLMAAMRGQWVELDRMLQHNGNHCDECGPCLNLLHMAVLWQDSFAVAMLLAHGADIDAITQASLIFPKGCTALDIAMRMGCTSMVRILLANSASPDKWGNAAANQNTTKGCLAIIAIADKMQGSVRELCHLAYSGKFGKIRELIFSMPLPLDVRMKSNSRFYVLHHVAYAGDANAYNMLLEAGASPLLRTSDRQLASAVARNGFHCNLAMDAMAAEAKEQSRYPSYAPCPPINVDFSNKEAPAPDTRSPHLTPSTPMSHAETPGYASSTPTPRSAPSLNTPGEHSSGRRRSSILREAAHILHKFSGRPRKP